MIEYLKKAVLAMYRLFGIGTKRDFYTLKIELEVLKPTLAKTQEELAQTKAELEVVKTTSIEIAKKSANLWYGLKNTLLEENSKKDINPNYDDLQELEKGIEIFKRELERK